MRLPRSRSQYYEGTAPLAGREALMSAAGCRAVFPLLSKRLRTMLDIELIRSDPEFVRTALLKRVDDVDLGPILEADALRRKLATEVDGVRSERNRRAKEIGKLKASGADTTEAQKQAAELGDQVTTMQAALTEAENTLHDLLMGLPNLPDERSPAGGRKPTRSSEPGETSLTSGISHSTMWSSAPSSGSSTTRGASSWAATATGSTPGRAPRWSGRCSTSSTASTTPPGTSSCCPRTCSPRNRLRRRAVPKFHDDVFHVREEEGGGVLPSSHLGDRHRQRIPGRNPAGGPLPIKAFAYSPCYRREAGSYRSEERGTIRGHQFKKVEMFQFTTPEDAERALQELVGRSQMLVEKLGMHYQTSLLAARDASASMRLTYDIEVWLPSIGIYKEVSSPASWPGTTSPAAPTSATSRRRQADRLRPHPQRLRPRGPAASCPRSSSRTSSPTAPSSCPNRSAPGSAPTSCAPGPDPRRAA